MENDNMIARAAKAIEAAEIKWLTEQGSDYPGEIKARAVIEAMREPTPDMQVAGGTAFEDAAFGRQDCLRCSRRCLDRWHRRPPLPSSRTPPPLRTVP